MYTVSILVTIFLLLVSETSSGERRVSYISLERPRVEFNRKYISYANITCRRFGRQNPVYYVDMHFNTVLYLGNNISLQFSFYKGLTSGHRLLMIEMTHRLCDLVQKDPFFGAPMRQGKFLGPCPYKPDDYHLYNMTVPFDAIPPNFPVFKGILLVNISRTMNMEFVGSGALEVEVKTLKIKEP